ncbi:MAG: TonB family protein [Thermoanaerobaculia bacterium]
MAENEIVPRLFGSYLLAEKIGADALGKVYHARKIEDPAAFFRLRIFDAPRLDSEPVLISIEENGAVHDFLKNPAVSRDVELDSVEGDAFLAYRDSGGRTLDALLEITRNRPFPIPIEHSLLIAEKIATGLDHAYNTMIDGERTLHGLVWPGFVDISDEGEIRLVGFGLAEGVLASRSAPALQSLLFPYLAPEVRSSGKPTRTGDVYSTAAILVTMLTGSPPPADRAPDAVGERTLFGGGEGIPRDIEAVLKVALAEAPEARYETAGALRRELGKLLFSGKYAPSTFNFAFFLTNLLKEEIPLEQARRREQSGWEASRYPRPAVTARPPRLVVAPRFGLSVAAVEEPVQKPSRIPMIAGGLLAVAILALSVYVLRIKGNRPLMPPPRPRTAGAATPSPAEASSSAEPAASAPSSAPAGPKAGSPPSPAAPTAGMSPEEFKNEVARRLATEVKKLETEEKVKMARAQAESRVASLKPVPAPISPDLSTPRRIPTAGSLAPAPPAARPAPLPVTPAAAPAPPATRRGDLVPSTELDRPPQIASVVKPEYPSIARRMNVSGTVVLSVLVTETGRVEDVRIVRDPGRSVGLPQAAEKAVRQWTFVPAQKDGVAVKTWYMVPIPFVL